MTWITTASGVRVVLLDPHPDTLLIEDIAHALSNICRYTGHTGSFYSVAQHSVLASLRVTDAKFALAALMHDASEAYLGDVSRPLKQLLGRKYADLEERFEERLAQKFRYPYPFPEQIRGVDSDLLETEYAQLLGMEEHPLHLGNKILDLVILPWEPHIAEQKFLARYDELAGQLDFDFGEALARALKGYDAAISKPLFYRCPTCHKEFKVGGTHNHDRVRSGSKKRQADDRGRSSKLPRGKRRKAVRRRRGPGTR